MNEFTSIDQLWQPQDESFRGGFENVRRTSLHPAYKTVLNEATSGDTLNPRYLKSDSSRTDGDMELTIFGLPGGEKAHLLPHSPICAPTWSIIAQAVIGVDLEEMYGEEKGTEWVKQALQQIVLGKKDASRVETGIRYSPLNIVKIPGRHQMYFDTDPSLLIIPIFNSLDALKNWSTEQEYWVMCITGGSSGDYAALDSNYWQDAIFAGAKSKIPGGREYCTPNDIENCRKILGDFVKAHADVLMGRGDDNCLKPVELFYKSEATKNEVMVWESDLARTSLILESSSGVKVPVSLDETNPKVMKVKLTKRNCLNIPDPALLSAKAAVSWSQRCSQKLLPTCPDEPDVDSDEELRYQRGLEEYEEVYEQSIRPPSSPTALAAALHTTKKTSALR